MKKALEDIGKNASGSGAPDRSAAAMVSSDAVHTRSLTYTVYSGRGWSRGGSARAQVTFAADVYGNQVETGICMGDYSFNYHIADADKLTVAQRDAFLDSITAAVQAWLDAVEGDSLPTKSQFKAAIEKAGKAAGNDKIQFTQCEIEYFEAENYLLFPPR